MAKLFSRKQKVDPALAEYPEALAGLLTWGETDEDADYRAWADRLADHVPDLVRMVLDDDLNERDENDPAVWAPLHALQVLGVLGPVEAAEPLTQCLDMDDEWFNEELPQVYAAIGSEAIPVLRAYLYDAAQEPLARGLAAECLAAIAQQHAEAYDEAVDLLTAFLDRPEADDSAAEEQVTTSVIYNLSTMGATAAYDAIRRAYAEDRVTPRVIALDDVEADFGMARPAGRGQPSTKDRESGVRLELRCTACGREREHVFPVVYYDLGTSRNKKKRGKYDPLIIPQRVVCPKCGAVDQYELGGFGHIAIMANMMAETAERSGQTDAELTALPRDQRIRFIEFTTRWGPMHPQEAIERYEREISRKPNDVSLHESFGNVLKLLGRLDEAEAHYLRGAELDPKNMETRIGLAQVAMLRKDIPAAISWWTEAKELVATAPLPPQIDRRMLVLEIDGNLADLRRGIIPEYEYVPTPAYDVEEETEFTTQTQPRAQRGQSTLSKVGRNDPCPCGSGKKYKHCHGRPGASAE